MLAHVDVMWPCALTDFPTIHLLQLSNGKPRLQNCPAGSGCRNNLRKSVEADCIKKIKSLGDQLGRDRVFVGCVAFGPPDENYAVLQSMAASLPRNSFQVGSSLSTVMPQLAFRLPLPAQP